jgi:hypothetical protein
LAGAQHASRRGRAGYNVSVVDSCVRRLAFNATHNESIASFLRPIAINLLAGEDKTANDIGGKGSIFVQ